jgi:glycosyltransferase involved in cell wall biosynthesis
MHRAAIALGLEAWVVGGRESPPTLAELSVVAALDRRTERHVPRWAGGYVLDPLVADRRAEKHLRDRVTPLCGPTSVVVASSVNHRHYGALARWLDGLDEAEAPALAVMLRVSEYDAARGRWERTAVLTRRGLRELERTARHRRVHLLTDSEPLVEEYGALTSLPVALVPIPYLVPDVLVERATTSPQPLRLGFFGQARVEKGFPVLVEALDLLAARGRIAGLAVTVQCYVRPGYPGQARHDHLAALPRSVRLVPEMLDSGRYYDELISCDAVLLPYDADRYRARTSGVFADAVAAGIPVVTTHGTWMAGELGRHGAGIVCADGDGEELAGAIEELRAAWPELRRRAVEAAPRWRAGRHPREVLRSIVGLFE